VVTKLQECLHDNLSLADLSSEVGLSPFHFSRMFKRSFGLAPHRYLIRLRVERACELLESTGLSVTEIALDVGYESSQSLARVFGTEMGMSPAAWRRERRR
jgi:AraC family transcriptional regulator